MGYKGIAAVLLGGLAVASLAAPRSARASVFAWGFGTEPVITALDHPVAVRFAPDGSVFVAEKAGLVRRFGPLPSTGTVAAAQGRVVLNLRASVGAYGDRGLLGLAIDPAFPLAPYVYVLYTTDAPPGEVTPLWNDTCGGAGQPDPNAWGGGCVAAGRVVRFTLSGDQVIGALVLAEGWYQQFANHSVGDLAFGPDGMLYASGGEGASFVYDNDVGDASQISTLYPNPGDPIGEGGALRSQDLLTAGDPVGFSGAVIRIDPASGPIDSGGAGPVVAFGLRNPYRMAFRPGTGELWVGDVGANTAEEVDRIADPTDAVIENFGWPCREAEQPTAYSARSPCVALTSGTLPAGTPGVLTGPHYHYVHGEAPGATELLQPCYAGPGAALTGVAFYPGARPARLRGALVLADYVLDCLFVLPADATGVPDPARVEVLARGVANIVDVAPGPDGDLFLTAHTGTILRLRYTPPHDPNSVPDATEASTAGPPSPETDDDNDDDVRIDRGGCSAGGDVGLALVLLLVAMRPRRRPRPKNHGSKM